MPVSSYAPEFLELFKVAARKELIIPINDIKRAMRLRFRLNSLRRDMRKEQHSLTTIANSVQFSITRTGDLRCSPADDQFLSDLQKAGIEVTLPPTTGTPSLPKPERADAEEVIKKFFSPEKQKE